MKLNRLYTGSRESNEIFFAREILCRRLQFTFSPICRNSRWSVSASAHRNSLPASAKEFLIARLKDFIAFVFSRRLCQMLLFQCHCERAEGERGNLLMKWFCTLKKDCFVAKNAPRNDTVLSVIASPGQALRQSLSRAQSRDSGQALRQSLSRAQSRDSGQATLELTAALILVVILLVGAVKIFVWINARIATQQAAYENSRVTAGSVPQVTITDINDRSQTEGVQVDDASYPQLNLF